MKLKIFNLVLKAIFAGICIGIAGWGFLGDKTLGMFLFIFGLATVVSYGAKLYTGVSGFCESWLDIKQLFCIILPGNIVGCLLVALMTCFTQLPVHEAACGVLQSRVATGPLACGVLAIGCGILMTSAVAFAKKGKEFGHWVPLLFAVPLFIHCGFPHCVADAFYFLACPGEVLGEYVWEILGVYVSIVIGNSVGCNIYRCILPAENYE